MVVRKWERACDGMSLRGNGRSELLSSAVAVVIHQRRE